MNTFDLSVKEIIDSEGGFVDDPNDSGGTTNMGISIVFAGSIKLDVDGDGDTDAEDIKAMTIEHAKEIYFEHFWTKIHGDLLPRGLAHLTFDGAVNQGVIPAIKDLQNSVGTIADGIIGDKTRIAAHKNYSIKTINELSARRMERYGKARNKSGAYLFTVFGLGWSRRLMAAHSFALDLAKEDGIK